MFLLQPPALSQPALPPSPAEQAVEFPGFNDHPLKGSLLEAGKHPFFAVLVSGTGAMDRDWNNPMVPKGNAGRDFAHWLKAQGLGSLRYDKRFLGRKAAGLDISLEAQVGDIEAALTFAKALPEAQGKKLLLIGHSEGALLSLLATRKADALLLIAPPGQSMAKSIQQQLRAQLPEDKANDNLVYLDKVLEAIRANKPTPKPGLHVFPALERLAKGLMSPESLDFVRATLDLDPWAFAARLTVPCALLWGDRDVQSPRPNLIPATFHGIVLDLPKANHLLKREERPLRDLNPGTAVSAYGEDTPLANLGALAEWLGTLK